MRQLFKQWSQLKRSDWRAYFVSAVVSLLVLTLLGFSPMMLPVGLFMLAIVAWLSYAHGALAGLLSLTIALLFKPILNALAGYWNLPEPAIQAVALPGTFFIAGLIICVTTELVQRGRRLQESEKKLHKSTLANISDAVIHTDAEGRIEYLNPAAATLLGVQLSTAKGKRFEAVVDIRDERNSTRLALIDDASAAGITLHPGGGQVLMRGDERIPVEAAAAPVRTEAGELAGVVLTIRNCTEQRRIDKETRARLALQSRLERIAAVVPGALMEFQVYPTGRISLIYASQSFRDILGIEPETCATDCAAILACVHPDDLAVVNQTVAHAIATTSAINIEQRWLTPHRGLRWIGMSITPSLELSDSRLWHGLMLDVTDRKRAEEQLRTSQLQLHAALEAGDMGVLEIDLATGKVHMDAAGRRLWSFSDAQGDLCVQDMLSRVHPDDLQAAQAYHHELCTTPMLYEREYHLQWPNTEERWLLCRGRVYRDEISRTLMKVGVMIDTTQHRHMQQQRLHSQKLEAMGILAGGIAHDFNNLLLAISGNAKLLLADLNETDARHDSAREIDKAAARAADLVRRILSFSSVPELNRHLKSSPLRPMLDEVMGLARAVLPTTVHITTQIPETMPQVYADSGQVHQVLINLLTNAADAVHTADAHIGVSVEVVEVSADRPLNADLKPGSYVCIHISDNGHGMDQAAVQRIFDPFYTTKPPGRGTGLGLAIVHGVMRSLEGAVSVTSSPGKGSTFSVYFPVSVAANAPSPRVSAKLPVAQPVHILYVDDEEALVFLLTRTLERMGHKVTACVSPEEAWEIFRTRPQEFDVVISDMSMPGMTGIELAEQVLGLNAAMPFIITSGYLDATDVQRAQALGVRQMILKPNTVEELGIALSAIVPRAAAGREQQISPA